MGPVLRSVLVVCATVALTGLLTGQPASARHQRVLDGNRVSLFGDAVQTYPAAAPAFVVHGWVFPIRDTGEETGWSRLPRGERSERLDDAVWRFELFIDGAAVPLERFLEAGPTQEGPGMFKLHGVQFAAGAFAPGTYTFTGVWYGDGDDDDVSEIELTRTVTVVFTP